MSILYLFTLNVHSQRLRYNNWSFLKYSGRILQPRNLVLTSNRLLRNFHNKSIIASANKNIQRKRLKALDFTPLHNFS